MARRVHRRGRMESCLQDLRHVARTIRRHPGFAALVVATLGLGIGASAAIFTVFDAALLRPLPYPSPDRLAFIGETSAVAPYPNQASYPDFKDWRAQASAFESMGAFAFRSAMVTGGAAEVLRATRVSAGFLPTLGVAPQLGRNFTGGEEAEGGAVILSDGFWRRRFGGDPGIVGRGIAINGEAQTIVGVLPAGFAFDRVGPRDVWLPLRPSRNEQERRYQHMFWVVGRLRPGVGLDQARTQLAGIAARIAAIDPRFHAGRGIGAVSLHEAVVGAVRPMLNVLLGAVTLVLLIACANVANVLLARGVQRERELVLRAALGATRGRLLFHLLAESVVLALLGGLLGVLWAGWGVQALVAAIPTSVRAPMSYLGDLRVDGRVLFFAAAASIVTGILAGLVPALRAARARSAYERLKEGAHTVAHGRHRFQEALIAAEVAFALVLLLAAGLLTRSLARLMSVDPGFDTRNLLTFQVAVPPDLAGADKWLPLSRELRERLRGLPGVRSAATVDILSLTGGGNTGTPSVVGRPLTATARDQLAVNLRQVGAGYFEVMQIPLLAGRGITADDVERQASVAVINRALERRLFPGEDPTGRELTFAFTGATRWQIVGVVGDERVTTLDAEPPPTLYWPESGGTRNAVVVRTVGDPRLLAGAVERAASEVSREVAVFEVATMEDVIASSPRTFLRRYPALLLGSFGACALLLAVVGIYGVLTHDTARRTREIGVRVALGARRTDVARLVLGRVLVLTAVGIVLGIGGSLAAGRALAALLFQVAPGDPWATAGAAGLMVVVALVAAWLPARRALAVDPMRALRQD